MPDPLAIVQATPYAWEAPSGVNQYVARVSEQLAQRGHSVLIMAPSEDEALVGESRRRLRDDPASLLDQAASDPVVLGVGEVLSFAPTRRRAPSLPIDVARTIEDGLTGLPVDIVHVHEPFAPSAASAALRHSHALNVASFHVPTERLLSTQLTRPLTRLLFSRLDARIASYRATRDLLQGYFPGDYRVILPGADIAQRGGKRARVELFLPGDEERGGLRLILRALRSLPDGLDWHATVWASGPLTLPSALVGRLRDRVEVVDPTSVSEAGLLARSDIAIFASEGAHPVPGTLAAALAARVVPVTSALPVYAELVADGKYGLEFEPGDAQTLASHLTRLISEPDLLRHQGAVLDGLQERFSFDRVTDELERVYSEIVARRRHPEGAGPLRTRLRSRRLIDVDLHMHTDHSSDCATPVEVLLAEARGRGLGAIAITDHNEISGAHEARAKADGIKVIVAEEVKTAEQGEVIGLFIEEKIPRGMTLQETIAEIRRQGGLVARRHDGREKPAVRRRLVGRGLIDVDLHMHTDHSYDCATPVEVLLAEAKSRGLGAIAITDHNEISGALEARAKADGVKVIVAEEVKTAG
ncbi:MAG: PHP domain-containing protein, partial [Solirubrobacterales bacterium]|nr:PHP domain-containing protein [Solirubrobacterales bacterium]